MKEKNIPEKKHRRTYKSLPLDNILDKITNPIIRKRGFVVNKVINEWDKIVGKEIAKHTAPQKINFQKDQSNNGTLFIVAFNSSIATELLFQEQLIVEKLSCFFGYKAIGKLKIIQQPNAQKIPTHSRKENKINLSEKNLKIVNQTLKEIDDDELKEALMRLGNLPV